MRGPRRPSGDIFIELSHGARVAVAEGRWEYLWSFDLAELAVVFSKLVEAVSKGRGRAASALDRSRDGSDLRDGSTEAAAELGRGDAVVVEAGEAIPIDGGCLRAALWSTSPR
jgi:high-affinity K+ transport system ATPase subunit B